MGKIYMTACMKGGCAKTVTTYNLAYSLKELGKKVLCVDFDSQANLSTCFGVENPVAVPVTIGHLMMAQIDDDELPGFKEYIQSRNGVDFISSSMMLSAVDAKLRLEMGAEKMLSEILEPLRDRYDAIIIDCMPSLGMITINALAASDEVLIPVEASYLPIKGLQQLLKTIGKVRKQINPKLQVGGILFTMVDAHTNDARNNMELLRNVYGSQIHIFDNYIPFSVRMKEAVREGQSIFSYDPKGKATEAYRRVTEEVLKDAI